jgi:hypothetical protein
MTAYNGKAVYFFPFEQFFYDQKGFYFYSFANPYIIGDEKGGAPGFRNVRFLCSNEKPFLTLLPLAPASSGFALRWLPLPPLVFFNVHILTLLTVLCQYEYHKNKEGRKAKKAGRNV